MLWDFGEGFAPDVTVVGNRFIDEDMVSANGEYVKVYLYLLRHQKKELGTGAIAEALHYTEGDVKRAITYWKRVGVLADPAVPDQEPPEKLPAGPAKAAARETASGADTGRETGIRAAGPAGQAAGPISDEDFSQLLYIAQTYLNRGFTHHDSQVFAYLYDELKMPAELLEYLVEYCVQNGHTSIRYMEKVALNWHQAGISTVEQAKAASAGFSKDSFAVMKAFGLTDRQPAQAEKKYIETWYSTYGFTRELVLEACNRTIEAIHSPSFKYADKILKEWKKAGVKNLADVIELDQARREKDKDKPDKTDKPGKKTAANRFHNFEPSNTDYDALMMERVRARMKE